MHRGHRNVVVHLGQQQTRQKRRKQQKQLGPVGPTKIRIAIGQPPQESARQSGHTTGHEFFQQCFVVVGQISPQFRFVGTHGIGVSGLLVVWLGLGLWGRINGLLILFS